MSQLFQDKKVRKTRVRRSIKLLKYLDKKKIDCVIFRDVLEKQEIVLCFVRGGMEADEDYKTFFC